MLKYLLVSFFLIFTSSCEKIDFFYEDSKSFESPLYNKSIYEISGDEIPYVYQYVVDYLGGKSSNKYYLISIYIEEEKVKRAVQTNQAISRMDYEIDFSYNVKNLEKNCGVFNRKITSTFTYTPKSSGFNFGSDKSLDKMYEIIIQKNLEQFVNFVSKDGISNCIDEN